MKLLLPILLTLLTLESRAADLVATAAPAPQPAAARTHSLEEAELNALLTAALQRDYVREKGALELRFTRNWTPVAVPDSLLDVHVLDLPSAGVTANFILRFQLTCRGETVGTWQMPLRAMIWREMPVARENLKRGQLLNASDFTLERRDLLGIRDNIWDGDCAGAAFQLADMVQAGSVLYARSVTLRPVVRRGQRLHAQVLDGAMSIALKVEALEDGAPGQLIRVRNTQSQRELRGKVQDERTLQINL